MMILKVVTTGGCLEAEKYDSKRTYKGFDGYSPGVFTI